MQKRHLRRNPGPMIFFSDVHSRSVLKEMCAVCVLDADFIEQMHASVASEWLKYIGRDPEENLKRTKGRIGHMMEAHGWIGKKVRWVEQKTIQQIVRRTGSTDYSPTTQEIQFVGTVKYVLPQHTKKSGGTAMEHRPYIRDGKHFSLMVDVGNGKAPRRVSVTEVEAIS